MARNYRTPYHNLRRLPRDSTMAEDAFLEEHDSGQPLSRVSQRPGGRQDSIAPRRGAAGTKPRSARGRSWVVVLTLVIAAALVLGGLGTQNARAVTTSGKPVDLGMSVIAVNITSLQTIYSGDIAGPFYQIDWAFSDPLDSSIPPHHGSIGVPGTHGCGP